MGNKQLSDLLRQKRSEYISLADILRKASDKKHALYDILDWLLHENLGDLPTFRLNIRRQIVPRTHLKTLDGEPEYTSGIDELLSQLMAELEYYGQRYWVFSHNTLASLDDGLNKQIAQVFADEAVTLNSNSKYAIYFAKSDLDKLNITPLFDPIEQDTDTTTLEKLQEEIALLRATANAQHVERLYQALNEAKKEIANQACELSRLSSENSNLSKENQKLHDELLTYKTSKAVRDYSTPQIEAMYEVIEHFYDRLTGSNQETPVTKDNVCDFLDSLYEEGNMSNIKDAIFTLINPRRATNNQIKRKK